MENKKVRDSNIELLRIVAMIMIVAYHITYHCVRYQLVEKASIDRMKNGFFCNPLFYSELFLVEGLLPFGITANAVFIIISGYFLVEKGKGIDLGKISKKLLLQVGFATAVLTIGSAIYYRVAVPDVDTVISMRTILDFNNSNWWFVGYYFFVVVIGGLFLNEFLLKLGEKEYGTFLLVVFGLVALGWSGGDP